MFGLAIDLPKPVSEPMGLLNDYCLTMNFKNGRSTFACEKQSFLF